MRRRPTVFTVTSSRPRTSYHVATALVNVAVVRTIGSGGGDEIARQGASEPDQGASSSGRDLDRPVPPRLEQRLTPKTSTTTETRSAYQKRVRRSVRRRWGGIAIVVMALATGLTLAGASSARGAKAAPNGVATPSALRHHRELRQGATIQQARR